MTDNRMEPTPRRAARLLVIDPASGAVLLFQYDDDGRRWWVSPGGGLDGDETFEEAAIREAAEELGISARNVLFLWHTTVEFSFRGRAAFSGGVRPCDELVSIDTLCSSVADLNLGCPSNGIEHPSCDR